RVPDVKGMHGYDNAHPDMAAIFIAHGPAFAPGARPAPASAPDLYPLLVRLLGIVPQPHEGDAQAFAAALRAR
ncbi:MAG: alkaline phosphatase family protein, partial [Sphingomonadaceae bacterium]